MPGIEQCISKDEADCPGEVFPRMKEAALKM